VKNFSNPASTNFKQRSFHPSCFYLAKNYFINPASN